tara:strand:+ start:89 stop:529 length:441 start_codon:yes stop_codon:yes gene_type:complete
MPYCRACEKRANRDWYANNQGRKIKSTATWIEANHERKAAKEAVWRRENPERIALKNHRRRAFTASNGVKLVTGNEIATITAMPCTACGVAGPSQVDHIVPIARGGAHTIGNLMPLCASCNASKCDLLYIEWKHSNRPQAKKVFAA